MANPKVSDNRRTDVTQLRARQIIKGVASRSDDAALGAPLPLKPLGELAQTSGNWAPLEYADFLIRLAAQRNHISLHDVVRMGLAWPLGSDDPDGWVLVDSFDENLILMSPMSYEACAVIAHVVGAEGVTLHGATMSDYLVESSGSACHAPICDYDTYVAGEKQAHMAWLPTLICGESYEGIPQMAPATSPFETLSGLLDDAETATSLENLEATQDALVTFFESMGIPVRKASKAEANELKAQSNAHLN